MHSPKDSLERITLDFGDCIGVESCVDLKTNIDEEFSKVQRSSRGRGDGRGANVRLKKTEKEYPPPIPWLARTENSPSSHMPWIMRRYYSNDGRLIIKEEKVQRHEYFHAHRSNGRLTLHLVPLDDDVLDDDHDDLEEEVECGGEIDGRISENGACEVDQAVEEEGSRVDHNSCMEDAAVVIGGEGGGGGGGGRLANCYRYSRMSRRNSCMFGMAVATIRPVHI